MSTSIIHHIYKSIIKAFTTFYNKHSEVKYVKYIKVRFSKRIWKYCFAFVRTASTLDVIVKEGVSSCLRSGLDTVSNFYLLQLFAYCIVLTYNTPLSVLCVSLSPGASW